MELRVSDFRKGYPFDDEAIAACSEPWMQKHVYAKLNRKLLSL